MDDEAFSTLHRLALPGLVPISRADFERDDEALSSLARSRTVVEYYFTSTASVILYALNQNADIDRLFYVDADMRFFASPDEMLTDMGEASVYAVEHRFPPSQQNLEVYGRFNVGVLGFRNDAAARDCLLEWRRLCLEWCFDILEEKRFADQKYLDRWPTTCRNLKIAEHPGVNAAPWNKERYRFTATPNGIEVAGRTLICFHFQGLRLYRYGIVEPQVFDYGSALSAECLSLIYKPYLRELRCAQLQLGRSATSRRYGREPDARELWRTRRKAPYLLQAGNSILRLSNWIVLLAIGWLRIAQLVSRVLSPSPASTKT